MLFLYSDEISPNSLGISIFYTFYRKNWKKHHNSGWWRELIMPTTIFLFKTYYAQK